MWAMGDRLEVLVADVSYDDQFVSNRPTVPDVADAPTRVLGHGLESAVFRYRKFNGSTAAIVTDTQNLAAVEITLTHRDVSLRPNADLRTMSATLAVRANRFSPFQTPLFTKPGQITALRFTATETTITVTWIVPNTGGPPSRYLVQWKVSTEAEFTDEREVTATMATIIGLTTDETYTVQVTAVNAVGEGDPSSVDATPTTTTTTTTSTMPVTPTTL